jgi:hypothetical protein
MALMFGVFLSSMWPFQKLRDAAELRRLRQRMQNPHRWWVPTPDGVRLETNAEYLERLRRLAREWPEPERSPVPTERRRRA